MAPIVAQEIDVVERVEPVGVVDHERVARALAEAQELGEHKLDPGDVRGDFGIAEQLARLVLAGRVADLRRATADEHDRAVAGLLQLAQHHDADQVADMERRRGAVEADIAGQSSLRASLSSPASSVAWWTKPRAASSCRKSDFSLLMGRGPEGLQPQSLYQLCRKNARERSRNGRARGCLKRRRSCASWPCRAACRDRRRPPPSARPSGPRRNGSRPERSRGRSRCPSAS